jgi:hypothetical protein
MAVVAMAEPVSSGMLAHVVARFAALATWIAEPELLLARPHPVCDILAGLLLSGAYSDGLAARPDPPGVPALFAMADVVLAGACAGDPRALDTLARYLGVRIGDAAPIARDGRGRTARDSLGCRQQARVDRCAGRPGLVNNLNIDYKRRDKIQAKIHYAEEEN